mmetsp:Transcript_41404/g.65602  ORF Transcript_41404/g.65602 Transcript_41404/m.65602 type:complete len:463 (-) Transcript_41404:156-1544(-)
MPIFARFHHLQNQDQRKQLEDEAALKIQSCWRGSRQRKRVKTQKSFRDRSRPWGFYTHTLALRSRPQSGLPNLECPSSTRRWIWLLLEEPSSSQAAQALSITIIACIIFSIIGFILETVPEIYAASPDAWMALEVICNSIFTLEYLLRLGVCEEAGQTYLSFVLTPMNIFDLMAVVPFYIELVQTEILGAEDSPALRIFRLVRLARVIRIFKLGRYATGMRLFGEALAGSTTAISVLIFLLCMGVVLFSSALFYVEKLSCPEVDKLSATEVVQYGAECADDFNRGFAPTFGLCCTEESAPSDFPSIVSAFWWSLVTMTSVGYGEVYPRTFPGKCVGFVAMLVGMVLIALPVAIVGQKFQDVYDNHDLEEAKNRAAVRMKVMGEYWSLVPNSDVCTKLRRIRISDPGLSAALGSFSDSLEEVWEHREQLMRERKYEMEKQEEILEKVKNLLQGMEMSHGGANS